MFDSRNKRKPNPGHGAAARRARLHADNRVKPDDVRTVDIKESTGQIFVMPYNAQHIGARDEQQDYFSYSDLMDGETIAKYGSAAVLADGMGGMGNGAEASSAGVSEFLGAYAEYIDSGSSIEEALMFALDSANERVNTLGGAGSTLIGIVIKDNLLHWVSVGDSRLYLMRNGVMRQLNKEHVYSEILDERYSNGEISYEEAMNDPERYALTSYLGIPEIETVDRNSDDFPLFIGDCIMMCSDGLYKVMSDEEIAAVLGGAGDNPAQDAVDAALSKQSPTQDNVTVLVLKII